MALALLAFAILAPSAAPFQDVGAQAPVEAPNGVPEAAAAALKNAPARAKVGRVRGLMAKSTVVFPSAPENPYELTSSFAFPERSRMVLTNDGSSVERFQLGSTMFGRDVSSGAGKAPSYLLSGSGLEETLLDLAQRRSVMFWPGSLDFVGAGRTLSAQVKGSGILLATVNEATGLPISIRSFDTKGVAGAEIKEIVWAKVSEGEQPRPASFTFAAGGTDLWKETVSNVDLGWHFTDGWFLPADALAAVMGSRAEGKPRVAELGDAWVLAVPVLSREGTMPTLDEVKGQARTDWLTSAEREKGPAASAKSLLRDGQRFDGPVRVAIVLDDAGGPTAIEYEVTIKNPLRDNAGLWKERKSRTVWSQTLDPKTPLGFGEALASIQGTQPDGHTPRRRVRLRMDLAMSAEGVPAMAAPENLRLTIDTTELSDLEVPDEFTHKSHEATTGEDR